ncbi:MAG TPA: phosphatase PAP2 family protein [Terriglobales bacterium]|nr:phosphatase PAP2 family protein [Terriglobales bacterium]
MKETNPVTGNPLPEVETAPKPIVLMETVTLVSLIAAVGSLVLFAWIAGSLSHAWVRNFDFTIRNKVHEYATPVITKWMIWISFVGGDGLMAAAIFSITLFLAFRWRRAAVWMLVNISGALILDLTLKYSFARLRPIPFFVPMPRTPSFPSGHSLFSFCFYGVLAGLLADRIESHRWQVLIWTVAALLVGAIGLSRIYLGVHYPSDVVAGYLTGTLWVSTMVALDRVRKRRRERSVDSSLT